MPREISDEEYNYYKSREQVANFIESIYNDPALTREAKQLIKKKYPTLNIPDLDIEEKVNARLDAEKKERDEEKRKAEEAKRDEEIKTKRKKTQDDYGFTDDAMKDLEQMMVERNIGDYDVAATYKASKTPKVSEPTAAWDSTRWHHERQDGFAEIAKDPEAWGRNELTKAFMQDHERSRRS